MSDNIKLIQKLIKKKSQSKSKVLRPGNFLIYKYDAKDKSKVYDKFPLVFVLWVTKNYMLGLNFHYLPKILRTTLLNLILKLNKSNIKRNLPLEIDYRKIKPYLRKFGFFPIIRLYIIKRISHFVLNVPNENMSQVVMTSVEEFTGGKETSDMLYKKAVSKYNNSLKNKRK